MANTKKWRATFRITKQDAETVRIASGRVAQTIAALVAAGAAGITAAQMSCWAYRLGAYVHILRQDYGLDITTQREDHDGGWHGRYVLCDAVEILQLET